MRNRNRFLDTGQKLILAIAVAVFCFSAYQLIGIFLEYRQGAREYESLSELLVLELPAKEGQEGEDASKGAASQSLQQMQEQEAEWEDGQEKERAQRIKEAQKPLQVDFAAMKELNPDAAAWLILYGTEINYPVVQGEENTYYLNHTFYGTENASGAVFLDAAIREGTEAKNVIIYGHNMKDGSMFGTLSYYKNPSMAEHYPAFLFYTEEAVWEYAVFAAFETEADSEAYTCSFSDGEAFLSYIERMKAQSLYDTGVTVAPEDKIMTLSTCSGDDRRFVIQAKRVEVTNIIK